MPIDPTSGATGPSSPAMRTASSTSELGSDTFLKLLVAQLKYQNPLDPADGTEFLAQTAQFTMVEKLTALAEQSEQLVRDNQSLAAAALLGRTVSFADADGQVVRGTVTAAELGSEGATVVVGDQRIPFSQIRDVRP